MRKPTLNIIVPCYNEDESLRLLMPALKKAMKGAEVTWSVILVDDGSQQDGVLAAQAVAKAHKNVSLIALARNFGKEIALSAGLHSSQADAVIMMDADLQHPPRYIPEFIEAWRGGQQVIVGVRRTEGKESTFKHLMSKLFYAIINRISETRLMPKATDFRLLDREVVEAFNAMSENNRITRGMIDWLGYQRSYVYFDADERQAGAASYSVRKLFKLAADTLVSMSLFPLRFTIYLGVIITLFAGSLGLFIGVSKYLLDDKFGFTGPAALGTLTLFLVGIVLTNIGFLGLYVANIHQQVKGRPLYAINKRNSIR